jgi:hypothetical protein
LAPIAIYDFVPNGKNKSKLLVCFFKNRKMITCNVRHLGVYFSGHCYSRFTMRFDSRGERAMARGVQRRTALTAVVLLLVCLVPEAYSGDVDFDFDDGHSPQRRAKERVGGRHSAVGNPRVVRLKTRVISIDAEIEAERAGRPSFVRGVTPKRPRKPRRLLDAGDVHLRFHETSDVRWGLLHHGSKGHVDPDEPTWTESDDDAVTQFLVATDGSRGTFEHVAAALEAHGGGVAGVVPPSSFVAVVVLIGDAACAYVAVVVVVALVVVVVVVIMVVVAFVCIVVECYCF